MRIDDDFMNEVGLGEMPEEEKRAFMSHAEEELEVRIGQLISMDLSDAQMHEFEQITDENVAAAWLEKNAPNFRTAVVQVFNNFKNELLAERAAILG